MTKLSTGAFLQDTKPTSRRVRPGSEFVLLLNLTVIGA